MPTSLSLLHLCLKSTTAVFPTNKETARINATRSEDLFSFVSKFKHIHTKPLFKKYHLKKSISNLSFDIV